MAGEEQRKRYYGNDIFVETKGVNIDQEEFDARVYPSFMAPLSSAYKAPFSCVNSHSILIKASGRV